MIETESDEPQPPEPTEQKTPATSVQTVEQEVTNCVHVQIHAVGHKDIGNGSKALSS